MADTIQLYDFDTKIILDCVEDISAATTRKIIYEKPDGTSGEWTAIRENNTIYYLTLEGDIDQAGYWTLQSYIALSTGWTGYGEKTPLIITDNI